jgi:hypothetical protein
MGPKSHSASHWCRGARRGGRRHNEFLSPKVEPNASAGQFLVSLMIPVGDVQRHIAEEICIPRRLSLLVFPPLCLYDIRREPRRLVNVAVLAPKNGEQLLGRHRFLNELHESLVFERFCEKGESSRIERVLAH